MRKVLLSIITVFTVVSFFSCSDKKKPEEGAKAYIRPASVVYTGADSAEINSLVNEYVEALGDKDIDHAVNMLNIVRNDSIFPLDAEMKKGCLEVYRRLPVYDVRTMSFVLRSEKNNEVKIAVKVTENGDIDKGIGVTSISLNPVKIDGRWYLTLLDKYAEGVVDVYE